ncbi:hypothetical protein PR202_gb20472 [Eleusine coracana subsp. coracana]|uniref:Expansin-like EG45 domain-containing protein n=1 Tax=Eleusine coracana subsp. coracana TaxID=191504 RepID=A0AAV5FCC4_ELECO|nr:hypothetical protein PR202_gb20472 [Eleusine coracana subsp. coracana]
MGSKIIRAASSSLVALAVLACLLRRGASVEFHRKLRSWSTAGATWYGTPHPQRRRDRRYVQYRASWTHYFSSMIAAGGPSIFEGGKGCGSCYQVKCSGQRVVLQQPGDGGPDRPVPRRARALGPQRHGVRRHADQLRAAGYLKIHYVHSIRGVDVAFKVDVGSNPFYLALLVEYESGDSDLRSVELMQTGATGGWAPMQQSSGSPPAAPARRSWPPTSSPQGGSPGTHTAPSSTTS